MKMLLEHARRILDRHLVIGEWYHPCAQLHVQRMQRRMLRCLIRCHCSVHESPPSGSITSALALPNLESAMCRNSPSCQNTEVSF